MTLLNTVKDSVQREWYARATIQHGWSRNVLIHQIESRLTLPQGKASTNFDRALPAPQPELADQFVAFMATDAFQSIIPTTNWMYPAHTPAAGLPDGFDQMITPEKSLLMSGEQAQTARKPALDEWLNALSR